MIRLNKKLLREPLLHFLALGVVIFALNAWRDQARSPETEVRQIEVTAAVIDRLRAGYERQFGQAPNEVEMRGLVTAHIREEVFCREALALGLDRDDTIVRRRMAQKMEFLTGDLASVSVPDEASVRAFFEKNAERYSRPGQVSFRHVYFSKDKRGAKGEAAAREALAALAKGASDETLGDPFLHGFEFAKYEAHEITALFGGEFETGLGELPEGEWRGPVESSYGLHLVRVEARGVLQPAAFEAVRASVERDFNEERRSTANREIFEKLRERYQVTVDEAALANASTGSVQQLAQR
ncbi:MAG: peptidyl-prolyl cis-trans isomerase [Burkholderiales bacterium]|nr:peptidyl-prolyl cis-trans isomerase [Opitutaceae bacterium]